MRQGAPSVLIAGLGVAGATLAWWLERYGFEVTVVERASAPRTGGYMVDFWGLGYEVAARMGALEALRAQGYRIDAVRLVQTDGRPLATIGAEAIRRAMGDRFFSLLRGDLAAELHRRIGDRAAIHFDDQVVSATPADERVEVAFRRMPPRAFDLVIGAEGLHSDLRSVIANADAVRSIGCWAAAFSVADYPHRDEGAYVSWTGVGRQVARYGLRDGRTVFFFIFRAPDGDAAAPREAEAQKDCLRAIFGADGWECREIVERLDAADDLYFDEVAQVNAPRWSRGRLAIVGDAAWCPSLLAGEGASLAMAGAYVLAGELALARGDHAAAFARYETRLRTAFIRKQRGALVLAGWFAPKTRLGLRMRNLAGRVAALPPFLPLLLGDMLNTPVELPRYGEPG